MRARVVLVLLSLPGCVGPFTELPASPGGGPITVATCGNSSTRAESVIAAMDGPPLGETGGPRLEPPKEVTVCVRVDNHGSGPVKVDRSRFHLKCSYGVESWIEDAADTRFVVPAGETRKTRVTFHYSKILSGEDARLEIDDAVTAGDRPVHAPAILLRKK